LPGLLRCRAASVEADQSIPKHRSVILLWMTGGPSHIDTSSEPERSLLPRHRVGGCETARCQPIRRAALGCLPQIAFALGVGGLPWEAVRPNHSQPGNLRALAPRSSKARSRACAWGNPMSSCPWPTRGLDPGNQ
jgi:hypothetical protein